VLVYCVVVIYLQVCLHSFVLYIVFSYALFSYVHIASFYFLHVNQQDVPVWYVVSDPCACPNCYLLFHTPSPPAAIMLGAISVDIMLQQVGMKGQQVKYAKQLRASK
jgi:hypothetical protein